MTPEPEPTPTPSPCHCGMNGCETGCGRRAPRSWIWMALAVAVLGVLVAKNAVTKTAVPTAASEPAALGKALPRLVDLGAHSCIPCKMMTPILDDLKKRYAGKLEIVFIDVWEDPDAGKKHGINVIPTQIFYDAAGKELYRHEGFFGKDNILAKWKELGVAL